MLVIFVLILSTDFTNRFAILVKPLINNMEVKIEGSLWANLAAGRTGPITPCGGCCGDMCSRYRVAGFNPIFIAANWKKQMSFRYYYV